MAPEWWGRAPGGENGSTWHGFEVLVRSAVRLVRENPDMWRLSFQIRLQPDALLRRFTAAEAA